MYDSATDHPRYKGTHQVGHISRFWAKDDDRLGRMPKAYVRPASRALIAAEIRDDERFYRQPVATDVPGLKRAMSTSRVWPVCIHGFQSWEAELVGACSCTEFTWATTKEREEIEALEMANVAEEEGNVAIANLRRDVAEWELDDQFDLPENVAWSSVLSEEVLALDEEVSAERMRLEAQRHQERDDEDLADDYRGASTWLAGTLDDLVDAVGDGFTIEGPSVHQPSLKTSGNVRVHELARECGVPSAAMIRHLRLNGEYVANNLSYVANPVADDVRETLGIFWEVDDYIARLRNTLLLQTAV